MWQMMIAAAALFSGSPSSIFDGAWKADPASAVPIGAPVPPGLWRIKLDHRYFSFAPPESRPVTASVGDGSVRVPGAAGLHASVTMPHFDTIVESEFRDHAVQTVTTIRVMPDGKTLWLTRYDYGRHASTAFLLHRQ